MLVIEGIQKRFGSCVAVNHVSFSVPTGQMVAVIGPSGAGKSTLLRLINRLADPSGGHIRYAGRDITRLSGRDARAWRMTCAMIFQQFNLVSRLDVLTNVVLGRLHGQPFWRIALTWFPQGDRALAAQALDRLGMLPQAFQRAESLSGGQQQRVAIARALVQQPRLLLADEPIASLDPANAETVMAALRAINREDGITVICSLHQVESALRHCDRVIGLKGGAVALDAAAASVDGRDLEQIYGPTRPTPETPGGPREPRRTREVAVTTA